MVNNHGDRFRPVNSVVPLPNGLNGLNGLYMGVTNYLLTGMILQVQRPKFNMEAENDGFQDWFISFLPGNGFKVNHVKLQGCIHPHVFFKGNFKSTEGLLLLVSENWKVGTEVLKVSTQN